MSGNSELVPDSLCLLIDIILKPKENYSHTQRKSVSIQHAIIAAVRPRSFVSPLHTGLSIHLRRKYGSRMLLNILSNLGFCAPYREVLKYEASVTMNAATEVYQSSYIKFVYDNADCNVATLDGHKTFNSMGGIKCVMPADLVHADSPIPRTEAISAAAVAPHEVTKINVYQRPIMQGYSLVTAEDIRTI